VNLISIYSPFYFQLLFPLVELLRHHCCLGLSLFMLASQPLMAVLSVCQLFAEVAQLAGELEGLSVFLKGLLALQFEHALAFLKTASHIFKLFS
jgi:hypothetical protein